MKGRHCLAIGIALYALALTVRIPATIVDSVLLRSSDGRLRLSEAQGSIWTGAGLLEFRDPSGRNAIAKSVTWHILPQSGWRGHLAYDVSLDGPDNRFVVAVFPSRVEIGEVEVRLPAEALSFAEPRLKPLRLSGDLRLRLVNTTLGRQTMLGYATLQWLGAGSAFSPVSPIGSYELGITGTGTDVRASLNTLQGPLLIEGSGSWPIGKNPSFRAAIGVPLRYREQLDPLLRLISVQRGEGNFELELR